MKPLGPIPAGFEAKGGELSVGGKTARDLVAQAGGTPLFVYSRAHLDARMAELRAAMPARLAIHYAVKANSWGPVLSHMAGLADGFDIASGGELKLVTDAGIDPALVSFAGPGKRDWELEAAISLGVTLNCESENEARRALVIGERLGTAPRLAIRVNPDFELRGSGMKMGGGAKPFGIDAERVPALVRSLVEHGAEWRGFHIFAGSQALDPEALIEAQRATLALAASLSEEAGESPPLVNLGGGFGIPYFAGEQPLDIERVAAALLPQLHDLPPILANSGFAIELGRWLVGESGVYLTRIVDRKVSHGKTFLVTDGGMHHQLAASGNFGQVIRRNYPVAIANRMAEAADEEVTIVGCLCTPLDRLADDVMAPAAQVGDLVAVFLAGAYGLSASPQSFLGHEPAREILVGQAD